MACTLPGPQSPACTADRNRSSPGTAREDQSECSLTKGKQGCLGSRCLGSLGWVPFPPPSATRDGQEVDREGGTYLSNSLYCDFFRKKWAGTVRRVSCPWLTGPGLGDIRKKTGSPESKRFIEQSEALASHLTSSLTGQLFNF